MNPKLFGFQLRGPEIFSSNCKTPNTLEAGEVEDLGCCEKADGL